MTLGLGQEHVNTFALEMGQKQHTGSLIKKNVEAMKTGLFKWYAMVKDIAYQFAEFNRTCSTAWL